MKRNKRLRLGTQDLYQRFPEEKEAWLLSYADVITMLLCFFMIFYSAEKKDTTEHFNSVISFIQKELGVKGFEEGDMKDVKKLLQHRFGGDQGFISELQNINEKGMREVLNYSHYVSIEFPQGNLFEIGSTKPTIEGFKVIEPVLLKLLPYQDKLVVNIVAYTDPSPVKNRSDRWWKTNQELSALRALEVQKLFFQKGFKENSVYISGRGVKDKFESEEKPKDLEGHYVDLGSFNESRTVSIRIEAKGHP